MESKSHQEKALGFLVVYFDRIIHIHKNNSIALTHFFLQGILIVHNILINKITLGN